MATYEKPMPATAKLPPHPAWIVIIFVMAFLMGVVSGGSPASSDAQIFVGLLSFLAFALYITWIVLVCIFFYRLWILAQASNLGIRKPTPGKAIGFTFIPLFCLYWYFVLYRNLALHLNHLTTTSKIPVTLVTVGVALVCSIFLSLPGGIILLISNFYFYKSAKELFEKE